MRELRIILLTNLRKLSQHRPGGVKTHFEKFQSHPRISANLSRVYTNSQGYKLLYTLILPSFSARISCHFIKLTSPSETNILLLSVSPPPSYSQSSFEELSTAGADLPPPSYTERDLQPYRSSGVEGSSPSQHRYIATEAALRPQSPSCSTLTDPNDSTAATPSSSLQRSGSMSFPKDDEWYVEQAAVESSTSSEGSTDEEGSDKDKTEVLAYE